MKIKWIICLLSAIWSTSCSVKEPALNQDAPVLFEKFHGRYKAIRSVSNEAIDVNLDGQVSTNMIQEIPKLTLDGDNYLQLSIYGPRMYQPDNVFMFTQWWPEQYIQIDNKEWKGEPVEYQPDLSVSYLMQGTPRYFTFSPDLSQLQVQPATNENAFRWILPRQATFDKITGTIQVVNERRLYTSTGVKRVIITTVYQRYTMIV